MNEVLARLRKTPIGLAIVVGFFALGLIGPWIAPYDPVAIDLLHEYEPPSWAHLLGTGDNGIDILSALLYGARLAAIVGVVVVGVSVVIGTSLGTWAGYSGRLTDHAITGIADLVQAFPAIVLNIAVLALVARPGLMHLIVALAVLKIDCATPEATEDWFTSRCMFCTSVMYAATFSVTAPFAVRAFTPTS